MYIKYLEIFNPIFHSSVASLIEVLLSCVHFDTHKCPYMYTISCAHGWILQRIHHVDTYIYVSMVTYAPEIS